MKAKRHTPEHKHNKASPEPQRTPTIADDTAPRTPSPAPREEPISINDQSQNSSPKCDCESLPPLDGDQTDSVMSCSFGSPRMERRRSKQTSRSPYQQTNISKPCSKLRNSRLTSQSCADLSMRKRSSSQALGRYIYDGTSRLIDRVSVLETEVKEKDTEIRTLKGIVHTQEKALRSRRTEGGNMVKEFQEDARISKYQARVSAERAHALEQELKNANKENMALQMRTKRIEQFFQACRKERGAEEDETEDCVAELTKILRQNDKLLAENKRLQMENVKLNKTLNARISMTETTQQPMHTKRLKQLEAENAELQDRIQELERKVQKQNNVISNFQMRRNKSFEIRRDDPRIIELVPLTPGIQPETDK